MEKMNLKALCLIAVLFGYSACERITEKRIRLDKWTVHKITAPDGESNLMKIFLPNFEKYPDRSRYIIDFYDDGTATSFNYLDDSLIYSKPGEWELLDKDHLYMDIDDQIDGEYEIHREKIKTYTLKTDSNYVESLGTNLALEIRVTRERDRAFRD